MRATATKRSVLMCLALPLLAGMAVTGGARVFICRLDPVPRLECCCQKGEHGASASVAATLTGRMAGCCDIAQLGRPLALPIAPKPAGAAPSLPPASVLAIVPPADLFASGRAAGPEPGAPPPPIPVLLQKRSLLL